MYIASVIELTFKKKYSSNDAVRVTKVTKNANFPSFNAALTSIEITFYTVLDDARMFPKDIQIHWPQIEILYLVLLATIKQWTNNSNS